LKDIVRESVEETLNELLEKEAAELTGAGKYERTESREGYRAGHYERTCHGDVSKPLKKCSSYRRHE
jgi:transposase-like protein